MEWLRNGLGVILKPMWPEKYDYYIGQQNYDIYIEYIEFIDISI